MKKRKILAILTPIAALFLATSVNANTVVSLKSLVGDCSNIHDSDKWKGAGEIETVILGTTYTCDYNGTATFTGTSGNFNVGLVMDQTKGSCPAHYEFTVAGSCSNGTLTINTPNANLSGNLTDDGHSVSLVGKIWFKIFGMRHEAKVNYMNLSKQ
jgi:hypothetical protein